MKEYYGIGSMECPLQELFHDWGSLQMTNNLLKIASMWNLQHNRQNKL